ncbi:hypothetical protein [Bifidobacterium panos]|uniref:hypothetical protein n=1 Tax=Bifidobacterium panos TaxID=2675321 RepID=UPI0020A64505|nr:hypothetical protein [Bifidobacterium sp. DSM 109963]
MRLTAAQIDRSSTRVLQIKPSAAVNVLDFQSRSLARRPQILIRRQNFVSIRVDNLSENRLGPVIIRIALHLDGKRLQALPVIHVEILFRIAVTWNDKRLFPALLHTLISIESLQTQSNPVAPFLIDILDNRPKLDLTILALMHIVRVGLVADSEQVHLIRLRCCRTLLFRYLWIGYAHGYGLAEVICREKMPCNLEPANLTKIPDSI